MRVLLVEDNPDDVLLVQEALKVSKPVSFTVEQTDRLEQAKARLAQGGIEVVLLDLGLPDSRGLATLRALHEVVPTVPIVILTAQHEEGLGLEAVREGAQDYLVKGQVDERQLPRVLRYAVERAQMQETLRSLAVLDDLTGLYNRRGFLLLAEQQLKLAQRSQRGCWLLFADLDRLKSINDAHGHAGGDEALKAVANVLQGAFRKSDIVARIGGDEFAVLAIEAAPDSLPALTTHLTQRLEAHNAPAAHPWRLALSTGAVYVDPQSPLSLPELMARADQAMYEQKLAARRVR